MQPSQGHHDSKAATSGPAALAPAPLVFPPLVAAAAAAAQAGQPQDGDEEEEEGPAAPPPTPVSSSMSHGGDGAAAGVVRGGNRANILDSLLEISLDGNGAAGGVGSMPSAARTMMELKALEKMRNEMNPITPVPSRKGLAGSTTRSGGGGSGGGGANSGGGFLHPSLASSLEQAAAGFAAEAGELASFERMPHGGGGTGGHGTGAGSGAKRAAHGAKKGGGRKAVLSTKARQRRMAGAEKEEAYADRLSGRVARRDRRKERMERLRRIY